MDLVLALECALYLLARSLSWLAGCGNAGWHISAGALALLATGGGMKVAVKSLVASRDS